MDTIGVTFESTKSDSVTLGKTLWLLMLGGFATFSPRDIRLGVSCYAYMYMY